jgi:hypothetical protein
VAMAPHLSGSATCVASRRVTDKVCLKKRFSINFPKPGNGAWISLVISEAGIRVRVSWGVQQKTRRAVAAAQSHVVARAVLLPDLTCPGSLLQTRPDAGVVMKWQ